MKVRDEDVLRAEEGPPDILTLQPAPIGCEVAPTWGGAKWITPIVREWRPGDTDCCGLCAAEHCNGRGRNFCIVVAHERLDPESARLYSTLGRPRIDGLGAGMAVDDRDGGRARGPRRG